MKRKNNDVQPGFEPTTKSKSLLYSIFYLLLVPLAHAFNLYNQLILKLQEPMI